MQYFWVPVSCRPRNSYLALFQAALCLFLHLRTGIDATLHDWQTPWVITSRGSGTAQPADYPAIHYDDMDAIDIASNPKINGRKKIINFVYHYTRKQVADGTFTFIQGAF